MARSSQTESKGIFTPQEAAEILDLSSSHIRRSCDAGIIPGSYHVGESRDRRIPATALLNFAKGQGIPIPKDLLRYVAIYNSHHASNRDLLKEPISTGKIGEINREFGAIKDTVHRKQGPSPNTDGTRRSPGRPKKAR